jgi:hypothetical protein
MTKPRLMIISATCVAVVAIGYFAGWHTWAGLAVRGTCRLYIKNDSDTPLRNIEICIANSIQPSVTNRFDILQPHQRMRVPVPKSHIYVWAVSWVQGQRTNTPNLRPGIKIRMGEIAELVVDSSGGIARAYEQ